MESNGLGCTTGTAYTIKPIIGEYYTITQTWLNPSAFGGCTNNYPYTGTNYCSIICPIYSGNILGGGSACSSEGDQTDGSSGGGGASGCYGDVGGDATNYASGGGGGGASNPAHNGTPNGGYGSVGIAIIYINNQST